MMMKTVAIRIKRLLAALLVLSLCLNALPSVGIITSSFATEQSLELLTSAAELEQANGSVLDYDTAAKEGWIGGDGITSSSTQLRAYFSYPTLGTQVAVGGVATPLTDCEVVYRVTFTNIATTGHARSNSVNLMLRCTQGGHTYELENRFGGQIYGSGHYMQIYVDGAGKNDSTSAVAGTPFYSASQRTFNDVPALKNGDTVELRVKCATESENGYIKLSLAGSQIGEFTYTGTTLPEFGLGSMKLMAKMTDISIAVEGASGWASCIDGHTPGDWIVDKEAGVQEEGSRHQECAVCGQTLQTETIPAIGMVELLISEATLAGGDAAVLHYDTAAKEGWIGGDGATADNTQLRAYFSYPTFGTKLMVDGVATPLTDCEVVYRVTFTNIATTGHARSNSVNLMLRYAQGGHIYELENRFGGQIYDSGHYMQIYVDGAGKNDSTSAVAGTPFYCATQRSFAGVPALKDGDTVELRVKCATESENGYIKLSLAGSQIGEFTYTGTTLPEFGLGSMKLMAKMSDISIAVEGASGWAICTDGHTPGDWIVDAEPGLREEGAKHQECQICGESLQTEAIPATGVVELLTNGATLAGEDAAVLHYDTAAKEGWIGGNGTEPSATSKRLYFRYPYVKNVIADGEQMPLADCEISYYVVFSDISATGNVRSNSVNLMLRYSVDGHIYELENRFGGQIYDSGHYMQIYVDGVGKSDSTSAVAGTPFYSEAQRSFAGVPALKNGDAVELRVKCATESENGYIKLFLAGAQIGEFTYTGTTLPEFGLGSMKLMAKVSDASLIPVGAEGLVSCIQGHTPGQWVVDVPASATQPGSRHQECDLCGATIATQSIPALGGLELLDQQASFVEPMSDRLFYDIDSKTGWTGGDGVTANATFTDRFFAFPTYADVIVDDQPVALTDCEVSYSVTFSDFTPAGNCRTNAVGLMLQYTDGEHTYKLENRFGGQIYDSGHYMQVYVDGVGKGSVLEDTGAPFFSTTRTSFAEVPALKNGDTVEMRIKCATDTENGYIKLLLGGQQIGQFTYTGKALPQLGLFSMKLMAKLTNASVLVTGATRWASCQCSQPQVDSYSKIQDCALGGVAYGLCAGCGNMHAKQIAPTTHNDSSWIVVTEPTARKEGLRQKQCAVCSKIFAEEAIPALGGVEMFTNGSYLIDPEEDRLFYDRITNTGWIGGDGSVENATYTDRYFYYPTYGRLIVDGQEKELSDCEISYCVTFSDFASTGHCRSNAVCLMLQYEDENGVYKLENRFGGQIYDTGHYMQIYSNGKVTGSVLKNNGTPFYTTSKGAFPNVPALQSGDTVEMRIKCASDTQDGYIKLYLQDALIGEFVFTGKTLPKLGLASMKLMARMSDVSVMAVGARDWVACQCETPKVSSYTPISDCTKGGEVYGACISCGQRHSKQVAPGNHTTGGWIVTDEPSTVATGKRHKECSVCGMHLNEQTMPVIKGMNLIDEDARFMVTEGTDASAALSYDVQAKTGWVGGNGTKENTSFLDRYFSFPKYANVMVNGQEKPLDECEVVFSAVFSGFKYPADKNCRNSAVRLMLRYTAEDGKVYTLENRFGGQIYDSGHYMQVAINGQGQGNALASTGAPFYSEAGSSFMGAPALRNGDLIEMKVKCASAGQDGYIHLFVNGEHIGGLTFTGKTLPEFGLGSMKLMAKVSDVKLTVSGASDWACCGCEAPDVKRYTVRQEASCFEDGAREGKCVLCGNIHKQTVPAAHTEGEWIVEVAAGCTTEGSRYTECAICLARIREEVVPAKGHSGYWVCSKEAGFLTSGSKHEECMICNEVWNEQTIPPTGIVIAIAVAGLLIAGMVVPVVVIKKTRKGKQTA